MPTRRPHRHSEAAILRTTSDQPPVSRRDEENECPVCGTREPPFTSDGTSEARERHVMSCLENHFGFAGPSTGSPSQAVAQPSRPAADPSAARAAPSASSLQASSSSQPTPAAPQGRPRAHTNRQRMLVYHATEKDCFNENGEPQECIICFEEFQPGDEMGRLECLCKFHRACIRGWWDTKGYGTCPTHQLHD
ncbi:hypothetical protein H2203_006733 [Taxawa tesnikishii (nom. ined.)]|nr:hypothetical protein H2203_006733 [Dothideales sp. JES 119]